MSDKLREALRRSADGWANAIEFGLLPEQHRKTATILCDEARAALAQLQSDQEAGQVTFQRWWIEHIRDGLVAMGKLPSGPLGDWAFLFREQLTDALNKPAPPPSSRMREALDTESIHQAIYKHTYMVLKGRVSERFLQEEFWNAAKDAAKEISSAGNDHSNTPEAYAHSRRSRCHQARGVRGMSRSGYGDDCGDWALAREIVWVNDEAGSWKETVESQIKSEAAP